MGYNKTLWTFAALMIIPAVALALAAQQSTSLSIAGQTGSAKVIQIEGRNYVEVEAFARLTNGSISFNGNQIVLTLPGASEDVTPPDAPAMAFSKDFVRAGIEAMAQVREWHAELKNAIEHSYPLNETWLTACRSQAQQALRLAGVAVNTAADKNALPFLTNEFNNMRQLSNNYLKMAQSMTYITPDALESDPLDQKISTCAHALASMATANEFVDDGSCQ
jgi:hypothetical protein